MRSQRLDHPRPHGLEPLHRRGIGIGLTRQRRFAEHREWMIRSFALTTSVVNLLIAEWWLQRGRAAGGRLRA